MEEADIVVMCPATAKYAVEAAYCVVEAFEG